MKGNYYPIAITPTPPYYAVISTSLRIEIDEGYGEMYEEIVNLVEKQPDCPGQESTRK